MSKKEYEKSESVRTLDPKLMVLSDLEKRRQKMNDSFDLYVSAAGRGKQEGGQIIIKKLILELNVASFLNRIRPYVIHELDNSIDTDISIDEYIKKVHNRENLPPDTTIEIVKKINEAYYNLGFSKLGEDYSWEGG